MFRYDLDSPISIGQAEYLMGVRIACYSCGKIFEITGDIPTHKVHLYLKEINGRTK